MTDLLALTAELVDKPSVSFAEADFVDWLEIELGNLEHLELTRVGDNLVARTNLGRSQRIILAGHSDTVPVAEDPDWPGGSNGFARIEGDTLWGLGSADMKGGLAVFLELARTVAEPVVDVTYVFYAREEVAQEHNGLNELVAIRPDLLEADCAILGEPTDGAIEAGCQGSMRLEVVLAGDRAHTARPWMGRNAIHRMAALLAELEGYEARQPVIDNCEYREAIQAVHVSGGVASNVVPDRVELGINHRFAPDRTVEQAEQFVRELLAPHLDPDQDQVRVLNYSPACPPSLSHPLLAKLRAGTARLSGSGPGSGGSVEKVAPLEVRAKLGWTDVANFAALGIPATNFGPGDPTVAHTKGEHLKRDSIERTEAALRALISR